MYARPDRYLTQHTRDSQTKQTSDEIGKGIPGTSSRSSPAPSSPSSGHHIPVPAASTPSAPPTLPPGPTGAAAAAAAAHTATVAVDSAAYLQGYRHQSKVEHPLYTTR